MPTRHDTHEDVSDTWLTPLDLNYARLFQGTPLLTLGSDAQPTLLGLIYFFPQKKLKTSCDKSQSSHRTPCYLESDSNRSATRGAQVTENMRVHWRSHISATWQRMYESASLAFAWDNSRIISATSSLQRPPVSRTMTTNLQRPDVATSGCVISFSARAFNSTAPSGVWVSLAFATQHTTHQNKASLGQGLRSAVRPPTSTFISLRNTFFFLFFFFLRGVGR